jgi:hypothetical protein
MSLVRLLRVAVPKSPYYYTTTCLNFNGKISLAPKVAKTRLSSSLYNLFFVKCQQIVALNCSISIVALS